VEPTGVVQVTFAQAPENGFHLTEQLQIKVRGYPFKMSRSDPVALAVASKLRGVSFYGVECKSIDGKGWGLTATKDLTTKDTNVDDLPKLMTIPHDLVLNQQTVEEYAKESREFKELYEAVGRQVLQPIVVSHSFCYTFSHSRRSLFPPDFL
jgi:hypothetical protein